MDKQINLQNGNKIVDVKSKEKLRGRSNNFQAKLPKCEYPGCKKEGKYKFALQLINEENACVELPFCEYHHLIIIGGHFKAEIHKNKEKKDEFKIIGPFKEVELIQQVMGAREMVAALTEKEKLENLKARKELGINEMIDLIMIDNPDMDANQAREKLLRISEENLQRLNSAFAGSMTEEETNDDQG